MKLYDGGNKWDNFLPGKDWAAEFRAELNKQSRNAQQYRSALCETISQSGLIEGELTEGYGEYLAGCGMWKESSDLFYVCNVEKIRGLPSKAFVVEGGWTEKQLIERFSLNQKLVEEVRENFNGDYHGIYKNFVWIWDNHGTIRAYEVGGDLIISPEDNWTVHAWTKEIPNYLNHEMREGIDASINCD